MQALGDRFYSTATHISATAIRLPPASHICNLNWNLHANLGVFGYARHLLVVSDVRVPLVVQVANGRHSCHDSGLAIMSYPVITVPPRIRPPNNRFHSISPSRSRPDES